MSDPLVPFLTLLAGMSLFGFLLLSFGLCVWLIGAMLPAYLAVQKGQNYWLFFSLSLLLGWPLLTLIALVMPYTPVSYTPASSAAVPQLPDWHKAKRWIINAVICIGVIAMGLFFLLMIVAHSPQSKTTATGTSPQPQFMPRIQSSSPSDSVNQTNSQQLVNEAEVYSTLLKLRTPSSRNEAIPVQNYHGVQTEQPAVPTSQPLQSVKYDPYAGKGRIVVMKNGTRYYAYNTLGFPNGILGLSLTDGRTVSVNTKDIEQVIEPITLEGQELVKKK